MKPSRAVRGARPSALVGPDDGRRRAGRARYGGVTLVEVIVAVVLLGVGLLASVSMVSLAARTLGEARRVSLAAAATESLADSLLRSGRPGASGLRAYSWGVLRWGPGERPGELRVAATDSVPVKPGAATRGPGGGRILVEVFLRLPGRLPASDPER